MCVPNPSERLSAFQKGFYFSSPKAVALNASESQALFAGGKIEKHGYFARICTLHFYIWVYFTRYRTLHLAKTLWVDIKSNAAEKNLES